MHNDAVATDYDVALMRADMKRLGWLPIDLARAAGVSHMTVGRFLSRERQTPRTALKLATALGHELARYLAEVRREVSSPPVDSRQLPLDLAVGRKATA